MSDDGFSERMEYVVQKLGGVRPAARKLEISTTQIDSYRSGGEPSRVRLVRIAQVAAVDLLWLATGHGTPDASSSGYTSIPIYDVRVAAGAASFAEGAKKLGDMPIDYDLLRQIGRTNAEGLAVFESDGDSMEPLIADGARVAADLHDTRLREGVFVFRFDDELRIKRLRRTAEGIGIISENPRYQPEELTGEALERFALIGRAKFAIKIF